MTNKTERPEGLPPSLCPGMVWERHDYGPKEFWDIHTYWKCDAPVDATIWWMQGSLYVSWECGRTAIESLEEGAQLIYNACAAQHLTLAKFLGREDV
jgi:hypothetical protein